eukprot:14085679-Alexandrium_andersonii.AAC.1
MEEPHTARTDVKIWNDMAPIMQLEALKVIQALRVVISTSRGKPHHPHEHARRGLHVLTPQMLKVGHPQQLVQQHRMDVDPRAASHPVRLEVLPEWRGLRIEGPHPRP